MSGVLQRLGEERKIREEGGTGRLYYENCSLGEETHKESDNKAVPSGLKAPAGWTEPAGATHHHQVSLDAQADS